MRPMYIMFNGNHEVVGMATTINGFPAYLTHLSIERAHRGQGHGRALLRLVCRDADREHRDLVLVAHRDDAMDIHRLDNMFEEFGFFSMGDDGVTMKREYKKT